MPKFFTTKDLIENNALSLRGEEAAHIYEVLRMRTGDELMVGDGDMTDFLCRIRAAKKDEILCDIIEKRPNENEPSLKITLFQALPKADKFETVVQKCVEIGVSRIIPIDTKNSMVKLGGKEEKKLLRWNKIAYAAAKQCGRGIIPCVSPLMSFGDAAAYASKNLDKAIIPYENEKQLSIKTFAKEFSEGSLGIFIGSEGGFDKTEIEKAHSEGIRSVTLGKRILRTETAGLVASVIMLYESGDLS